VLNFKHLQLKQKAKEQTFFIIFALKNTKLFGAKTQTFVQTPTKKTK